MFQSWQAVCAPVGREYCLTRLGTLRPGESTGASVSEHNLQLAQNQVPVLAPGVPVLHDPLGRQIEHPTQGVIVGEGGLVLRHLTELPVEPFDDVRRVYDFPNLLGIFKERAQNVPVFLPALDAGGIFPTPGIGKILQVLHGLLLGSCGVNFLQIGGHLANVLVADIAGGAADLMHDAPLQTGVGIDCLNCLRHSAQTIRTEQVNVHNTPAFEVIQHIQPEFAGLMLPNPDR